MTDLRQSLSQADFSHLKGVAACWGLPFAAPDAREGLEQLSQALLEPERLSGISQILSDREQEALLWVDALGGQELWDHFSRRWGEIREMGAGKLEREQPYLNPVSVAESLFYRALIARGFLDTDSGPREFVYLPEDLRQLLVPHLKRARKAPVPADFSSRQAASREYAFRVEASPAILDHLCTLLAACRMQIDPWIHLPGVSELELEFYQQLAVLAGLLTDGLVALPEEIRDFYELPPEAAHLKLWITWLAADAFADASLVPEFRLEGTPELDPVRLRNELISCLLALDPGSWWSLESFISRVKEVNPDLLRKSGEYDSWFIRHAGSGEYLKGFAHWDEVEGSLIRYLLTGPLHWLGFLDLGFPDEGELAMAFRLSRYSRTLIDREPAPFPARQPAEIQIRSKGEIRLTQGVPHKTRYQLARFCDWLPVKADAYLYTISPSSLARAEGQGLRVAHFQALLQNNALAIPPNILLALERWEKGGAQASLARKTILRLGSPAVLKALKGSRAARYILEQLGPTAVIVKEGSEGKIAEVLIELGFFLEIEDQTGSQA